MVTVDKIRVYEWIIQAQQWFFLQKLSGFYFIIPMPLAILPDIYEIWYFHDNLLSIIVPRNLVLSTSSMGLPFILMFTSGWGCFRLEKIMKCVFLIFSDNRLTFNHSAMLFRSLVTASCNCIMFVPLAKRLVSSANNRGIVFIQTLPKSFM